MTKVPEISDQLDGLTSGVKAAKRFSKKKPVQVVPSDFVGLNRAGKCGGVPAPGLTTVYGPSGEGKSVYVFGNIADFQKQNHLAALFDIEGTADLQFAESCGVDLDKLIHIPPMPYEDAVKEYNKLIKNFKELKKKKKIPKETILLVAWDSMSKLVPREEVGTLATEGRVYPLRAAMNAALMDKFNLDIYNEPIHILLVAHEKKSIGAKPFEEQTHIKGGSALVFEARQQLHICVKKRLKEEIDGKKVQIGKVHKGFIKKNKLGSEGSEFYFVVTNEFSENGIGFDRVKEVIEECKLRGNQSVCVRKTGAVWTWDKLPDGKIKGDYDFEDLLRSDEELFNNLVSELNETSGGVQLYVEEENEGD